MLQRAYIQGAGGRKLAWTMPRYEIQITDMTGARTVAAEGDGASSPGVGDGARDVVTVQSAPSEDLAKDWAWRVWDAKYGPGARPAQFRLGIKLLDGVVKN